MVACVANCSKDTPPPLFLFPFSDISPPLSSAMFLAVDFANNGLRARADFVRRLPDAAALAEYLGCCENGRACGPGLPGEDGAAVAWVPLAAPRTTRPS